MMKGCNNKIIKCLMEYDIFAVHFNFKYDRSDRYSSIFSFVISFIYITFSFYFIIYYLIPFIYRENYEFVKYSMTYFDPSIQYFIKSKIDFAYRLNCNNYILIDHLFQLNIRLEYIHQINEIGFPNIEEIFTYDCTYDNDTKHFKNVKGSQYKCFDLNNLEINDKTFIDNYKIVLSLKETYIQNFSYINDYLLDNDCKIELAFIDKDILLNEHADPIKPVKSSIFLELNPYSIAEMNLYFTKMQIKDKDNLFLIREEGKIRETTAFSRAEKYYNYRGNYLTRQKRKRIDIDYKTYAKILIKSESGISVIERKYQNLWEFIGVLSSVLIAFYTVLDFIISIYNKFDFYHSLSKKVFFFTDVKDEHLIYFPNNHKIINLKNKMKDINDSNNNDITFYENIIKSNIKNSMILSQKSVDRKSTEIDQNSKINFYIPQNTEKTTTEKASSKPEEIEFSFNIFEILFNKFCCCGCYTKRNFQIRRKINNKAKEILYDKLDIALYIKNIMLLALVKKILLGDENEAIIKFLSRPVLSLKENNNLQNENYNNTNCDRDFTDCEREVDNLIGNKKETSEVNKKLILYTQQQLKKLYGD